MYFSKKLWVIIGIVFLLSLNVNISQSALEPNTHYHQHMDIPGLQIGYFVYSTNSSGNIAHLSVSCSKCSFNFQIDHELNSSVNLLNATGSKISLMYELKNENSFSIDYTINANGTFYFIFSSTINFRSIGIDIDVIINTHTPQSTQPWIDLFPLLIVLFFVGVGILLLVTRLRLKRSKVVEYKNTNPIFEPNTPVIESENKKIPGDVIQKYWLCPTDDTRLQLVTSKIAGNPSFIILKERVNIGVNNAIALRKIPAEAEEQTISIVNEIFSKFPVSEISLVNTRCPICQKYYSVPEN